MERKTKQRRLAQQIQRNLLLYDPPIERTAAEIEASARRVAKDMRIPVSAILHDWLYGSKNGAPAMRAILPAVYEIESPLPREVRVESMWRRFIRIVTRS